MSAEAFIDTGYLIALSLRGDRLHARAAQVTRRIPPKVRLVVTEEVLTEYLNFFSGRGSWLRGHAADRVADLRADPRVEVLDQSHLSFEAGLGLYRRRSDKDFSLTDCISMEWMRSRNIRDILSADHNFAQEGFRPLLRDEPWE